MGETKAEPRLKIALLPGWIEVENPDGPVTFTRDGIETSGALQFSFAPYKKGKVPDPSEKELLDLCNNFASSVKNGKIVTTRSGACDFGKFGMICVRGDEPVCFQMWVISNGRDFVFVTHTCMTEPDVNEIAEADVIALRTNLG